MKKRVNYFTGEFLQADDFKTEQRYHREALREHNRNLHTWDNAGVAWGLDVTRGNVSTLNVSPGMAVDHQGRQIILTEETQIPIPNMNVGGHVYLTIEYHKECEDWREDTGYGGYTRIAEQPKFDFYNSDLPPDLIILAKIKRGIGPAEIDISERTYLETRMTALYVDQGCTIGELLTANQSCTIEGLLTAKSNCIVQGNLEVANELSVNHLLVMNDTTIRGSLRVNGIINLDSGLDVAQTIKVGGNLEVEHDAVVKGNLSVTGNLVQSSSRQLKTQITDLSNQQAYALLDGLKPVQFIYKSDPDRRTSLGFIAEEVPPCLASPNQDGIHPVEMLAVLTKVVKEQQVVSAQLTQEVKELRRELAGIK